MKKLFITLALILAPAGTYAGGDVTIIDTGDRSVRIFSTDEKGETRSSSAFRVSRDIWRVYDDEGSHFVFHYGFNEDHGRRGLGGSLGGGFDNSDDD